MILVNKVKCLKCGDVIESKHRHDFVTCSCGNVSVDGGKDYLRRTFKDKNTFEDLSIVVNDIDFDDYFEELEKIEDEFYAKVNKLEQKLKKDSKNPKIEFFWNDGYVVGIGDEDGSMKLIHRRYS